MSEESGALASCVPMPEGFTPEKGPHPSPEQEAKWEAGRQMFKAVRQKLVVRRHCDRGWWGVTAMATGVPGSREQQVFMGRSPRSDIEDGIWDVVMGFHQDMTREDALVLLRRAADVLGGMEGDEWEANMAPPDDNLPF